MSDDCCCWCRSSLIVVAIGVVLFILKRLLKPEKYTKGTLIENKVVVITGANVGLGRETAIELAKRGGKVYLACRDIQRGEAAAIEIRRESGSQNVHFLQLDLASLDSVREFSKRFHEKEKKLHILVNNAGLVGSPEAKTKDGFEMTMGVNHLGHFLLTHLLLDLLEASAPSRIVNVASSSYYFATIQDDDFAGDKHVWWSFITYSKSKLANILFTRELAKKLKGTSVTVNSCNPGVVPTRITRNISFADFLYGIVLRPILRTEVEGAQTQIRLALDPALDEVSGKYFENCKQVTPWKHAEDDEASRWLYRKSCELVKLKVE